MVTCYICGCELTKDNASEEHIFLNAIGGRLKSKRLLCKQCNSDFGNDIDEEMAKQFNCFANMLNIKRDRGEPQAFDVIDSIDGTVYSYEPGGIPVMKVPIVDKKDAEKQIHYTIITPNIKEGRKVLKGLKRKYPEIDVEKALQKAVTQRSYIDHAVKIPIQLGSPEVFRSLCKTAINFYMLNCDDSKNIKHLIPYIKGEIDVKCVAPFYKEQHIAKKDSEILHSIILKGDANEKILFAYIEIFDFYKVVILLNADYQGKDFESSYFYNVLTCKEIKPSYQLNIARSDIETAMNSTMPFEKMLCHLRMFMDKALEKQDSEQRSRLLDTAVENVRQRFPDKKVIDNEMYEALIDETMEQIKPWLLHNFK